MTHYPLSPFFPICDNRLADSTPKKRTITVKVTPGQWSWHRTCDWCGAGHMQPCTTPDGKRAPTHSARTKSKTAR
jgi:hypothetical protein